MQLFKIRCRHLTIIAVVTLSVPCDGATVLQDAANDYVWFQAGQYSDLSNPGLSFVEDNGDGTLSTLAREDQTSLVTYNIQFANPGDYFLYFRMEELANDSVFVNHETGFNSIPGDSDPERWNGLDTGWNGLFNILGDQADDYQVPAGEPAWAWQVEEPSTVSFTVRGREDGVLWQDFVFSQRDKLTQTELYEIIGVDYQAPAFVTFEYEQTDKSAGFGKITGEIDGITFTGELPPAEVIQNDAEDLPVPDGMVGYMNGWSLPQPGNPYGVHLGWSGDVTLQGQRGTERFEVDVPLAIADDGTPSADWYFETDLTDDGGNGNDAFGFDLQLAGWYGNPGEGHRRSAPAFGEFFEDEVDAVTVSEPDDTPGSHSFGDDLGIAISLRNVNGLDGSGWLDEEGSGVIYVDRVLVRGGLTVDRESIRTVEPGLIGDFDNNGMLDIDDINRLTEESASMEDNAAFDLNDDGAINALDVNHWVTTLRSTWIGDSNLDGEFNSADFVEVFSAGKYERPLDANWQEGDWNGDARFNSADFVAAFSDGGYEQGKRPVGQPVPEPSGSLLMLLLLTVWFGRPRSKYRLLPSREM